MKNILKIQGVKELTKLEKKNINGGIQPDMSGCRQTGSIATNGIVTVSYRCGGDEFGGSDWYLTYYNGQFHSHTVLHEI
ncbi:hypothetical protein [Kordia sp.]|uniref:hypothetical protein n=1 Tax=Kordia sp. TaxID=1965332 RepID=UPI003B58CCE8